MIFLFVKWTLRRGYAFCVKSGYFRKKPWKMAKKWILFSQMAIWVNFPIFFSRKQIFCLVGRTFWLPFFLFFFSWVCVRLKILIVLIKHQAVELWLVDKAVLPIENSVGGSIHRNYDLLLRHRLHIVGEVQMVVNHCLLGMPGVKKEELKRVLSHPQVTIFSLLSTPTFFFLGNSLILQVLLNPDEIN